MFKNLIPVLFCLVLFACNHSKSKPQRKIIRDTTINNKNSFSELSLDSLKLEKYISDNSFTDSAAANMRNFYNSRNYHFAWFTNSGLAEQTRAFWNLHNNELMSTKDSSLYDNKLHTRMKELIENEEGTKLSANELVETELHLTQHFFKYAKFAYEGTINPTELQWYIPRKKVDVVNLLDSLFKQNGAKLTDWEPISKDYRLLEKKLPGYYEIQKKGGFTIVYPGDKIYRPGDSAIAIQQVKERLQQSGDYHSGDTSMVYGPALEAAVQHVQKLLGLNPDGVIGPGTIRQLNVSAKERIEQILVNMERMKWMPKERGGTRLVANIPEFKLHVFEGDNEIFNMKIVVGKAGHNTVVFSDELKYIVFSPYWNVPASIVRNEILPAVRRDPHYLSRNNMEQTGTRNGLPDIRQKPGGNNALGRVKFIFPNSYNIYFHDTPAKMLFDENDRAFSHGCVRLAGPERLARYLLRNNKEWTEEKIYEAMHKQKDDWVTLGEPVPVYLLYFTAWVDNDGGLNFRDDIYGHDEEMKSRMFEH
ncbi:MAG: L,D-transpeptidase family protein [Ginsengibacter sp.]